MNDAKTKSTMKKTAAAALLVLLQLSVLAAPAAARFMSDPDKMPTGEGGTATPEWVLPTYGFTWVAPPRMENWKTAWHQRKTVRDWPVETYLPSYVNPPSWPITFMGCQSENDYLYDAEPEVYAKLHAEEPDLYPSPPLNLYQWEANGQKSGWSHDCYGNLSFPAEGTYYVTLGVKDADGAVDTYSQPIEVKDFLVVVVGDSAASGEGAPDVPLTDGAARAQWVDNRCHRSDNAGGAQAARRIENANPHTTVTFLSFACSGATLNKEIYYNLALDPYNPPSASDFRGVGMTAPYAGIEPIKDSDGEMDLNQKLPSQVDQLWNALSDFGAHAPRKVDALIVSGGINDARFADLAGVCVLSPFCYGTRVGVLGPNTRTLDDQFRNHDVKDIPGGWDAFSHWLMTPRLLNDGTVGQMKFDTKLALQYPPFLHDDEGDRCVYILHQSVPVFLKLLFDILNPLFPVGWTFDEIDSAIEDWAPDLDANVKLGAERNEFEYVDTIANRFFKHGVCADDRWINDPLDSAEAQGDADGEDGYLSTLSAKGTAHPNTKGYSAYADEILRHLNTLTKKDGGNTPPAATNDKVWVTKNLARTFNVLDNDYDDDPADVLSVRMVTQPQHGTAKMQVDGTTTYTPGAGRAAGNYVGPDSFLYELTDGQDVRFAVVDITVMQPLITDNTVTGGETTPIVLGSFNLEPPYRLVFDKPLRSDVATAIIDPHTGTLEFTPVLTRHRRRLRLPYTLYSDTTNLTSESYGKSTRGLLVVRVKRPR